MTQGYSAEQAAGRPAGPAAIVTVAALLLSLALPAGAATPKEVDDAVARGVKYLYQTQQEGNWEVVPNPVNANGADVKGKQWGGLTAMATYALLAARENPQDERLKAAINWLLKEDKVVGTYAVGLRAQVWHFLPANHPQRSLIRAAVKRDRDLLLSGMQEKQGEGFGFYGYFPKQGGGYDRSNSQYGVLGMWAAEQAGAEVPTKYWEIQDQVWKKSQNQDGGWEYSGNGPSSATMTAAGVATLFITQDYLIDLKKDCQGNVFNQEIEMGLRWMDRNIKQLLGGNFYAMYGVERIGVASGRKYFGNVDWYKVGADYLVKHQKPDGSWGDEEAHHNAKKVPNTCFSLYFLTRGRAAAIMNKLEYTTLTKEGKEAHWNQRPRDLANFSKWMSRNLDGRFINWQIVSLKADPHELHDAPILYISGGEAFTFKPEEIEKLKLFVEQGGLILGNADCGNQRFIASFRNLAKKMFPAYEFRDLEQNHPILAGQQFLASKWKRKPRFQSLGNGVRELMVLVPQDDLSKAWQTFSERTKEELYQLAANLYLYSVKEDLTWTKTEGYVVRDTGKGKAERSIKVARLIVGDDSDPEPGGWRRLGNVMKNAGLATLVAEPVRAGEGRLRGYKVAHWTGTRKFKLAGKARDEVMQFVNGGGTLLVDAAGGSTPFADSAADALFEMFGGDAARKQLGQPLPPTHALYKMQGVPIEKFAYRLYARNRAGGNLKVPHLAALEVGGRPAVFFSKEDLSAGLVALPVDGVVGYDPDTATAIVRNVVIFAETAGNGFPPPPPKKDKDGKEKDPKAEPKDKPNAEPPAAEKAAAQAKREAQPAAPPAPAPETKQELRQEPAAPSGRGRTPPPTPPARQQRRTPAGARSGK